MLLGSLVGREPITPLGGLAMVVIVGSVALVTTEEREGEPLDEESESLTVVLGEQA